MAQSEKIWLSSCQHIGARSCNIKLLEEHIALARKGRWKVLLLGDLIDNGVSAGSRHLGLEFQNVLTPQQQIEAAYSLWKPLAESRQIVAIFGGNHALRSYKVVGNHPEKILAMLLSGWSEKTASIETLVQYLAMYNTALDSGENGPSKDELKTLLHKKFESIGIGTNRKQDVPFFPGMGHVEVAGLKIAGHHGVHVKSRHNWDRLERAARGFDIYATGHNHLLAAELGLEDVRGKWHPAWFFSAGTYQAYEEYASLALYAPRPVGSVLVSVKNGKVIGHEFLTE
jgi:hypothetical protein